MVTDIELISSPNLANAESWAEFVVVRRIEAREDPDAIMSAVIHLQRRMENRIKLEAAKTRKFAVSKNPVTNEAEPYIHWKEIPEGFEIHAGINGLPVQ